MISDGHSFVRTIPQSIDDAGYKKNLETDTYLPWDYATQGCEGIIKQIVAHIGCKGKTLNKHGAELNALFSRDPKPGSGDCVTLIATRTRAGDFCSEGLNCILAGLHIDCSIIRPKHLGLAGDAVFITKGLPEFLNDCYNEIRQKKEKGYEIILCPNGGYKALIPYVTLAGLLEGLEIRYVYDDSDAAMALPHLPIGPDMAAFDESLLTLEDIQHEKDDTKKRFSVGSLPEKLKPLFDDGKDLSALGECLWNAYRTQADMTPLRRATGNKGLLAHLGDDLRGKFIALAGLDHLIWKGDRVPEMVEHASRHHTNLFRIAEKILLPCYDQLGDGFLSDAELFALLCALLLHDCGHVVGSVPWDAWNKSGKERLFPGEIREYHNILGFMRLKEGAKSDPPDPIYGELTCMDAWKGLSSPEIWRDFLQAPAHAGLYHRQAMPLKNDESPYKKCGFYDGTGVIPLADAYVLFQKKPISPERMLRIVSLLRLIDSLDNQYSRAGGRSFVRFHLSSLEGEIGELAGRIHDFVTSGALDGELLNKIKAAIDASDVNQNTHCDRERLRNLTNCKDKDKAYLIRHYFELLLTLRFKERQKAHYRKHLPVRRVVITPEGNGTTLTFAIDVEIDAVILAELQEDTASPPDADVFRKECVRELAKEYMKIEDILNSMYIGIKYACD
jgi:hypothetical protein